MRSLSTRFLFVGGMLVASAAAFAQTATPCDETGYGEVREAVEQTAEPAEPTMGYMDEHGNVAPPPPPPEPIAQRFDFAAMATAEICELPAALEEALSHAWSAPPEVLQRLLMQSVTADPSLILGMCGAQGFRIVADLGFLPADQQSAALVEQCQIDGFGLGARDALAAVGFERLLIGAVTFKWLESRGEPHAVELGRLLLGFGLTRPD